MHPSVQPAPATPPHPARVRQNGSRAAPAAGGTGRSALSNQPAPGHRNHARRRDIRCETSCSVSGHVARCQVAIQDRLVLVLGTSSRAQRDGPACRAPAHRLPRYERPGRSEAEPGHVAITVAAMTGPAPKMPVRLVPDALTAMASFFSTRGSGRPGGECPPRARRRARPAGPDGLADWRMRVAWAAVISSGTPPGPARGPFRAMRRQCQRASCAIWSKMAVTASISAGSCPGATSTP